MTGTWGEWMDGWMERAKLPVWDKRRCSRLLGLVPEVSVAVCPITGF
jgi:hypothetical protein